MERTRPCHYGKAFVIIRQTTLFFYGMSDNDESDSDYGNLELGNETPKYPKTFIL